MTTIADIGSIQHLRMDYASWELYDRMVQETAEQHLKITYDSGRLEVMSPLPEHEKVKKQIADMFAFLAVELDVPMCRLGSTTFRREDLAKGLEPDECYYIQNEPAVRGKRTIDLPDDPPPDLVVEVELTSWSIDRMAIYASLGVPEVWRWRADRLAFLHLVDGQYRPAAMSLAFPWLASADVQRFVRVDTENETALLRSWRDWVRANGPAQG